MAATIYLEENLSVDEQIIAYKGRKSSLRQYNPRKPKKWGWKVFVLSGRLGIIHKIEFYGETVSTALGGENVNKPGQVVLRLAENIPSGRNFKLFFDNWFNSPGLQIALALRQIWSIGTLMVNRAPGLKFDHIVKPARGSYVTKTMKIQDVQLFATQWFDNKPVTVLSTFCAGEPEVSLRRYDRVSKTHVAVQAPQSISVYNKHMGYVDEINSYLGRFRVTTHFRTRAYLKIFLNFVNIIATNCWAQYRRDAEREGDGKKDTMSLYVFKSLLAESLCKTKASRPGRRASLDEIPIKRPRPGPKSTLPMADIRLDRTGHWPIGIGSSMRGGNCKMPGCKSKPVTKCEKCDVHLCVAAKNCFKVFHTVERL